MDLIDRNCSFEAENRDLYCCFQRLFESSDVRSAFLQNPTILEHQKSCVPESQNSQDS